MFSLCSYYCYHDGVRLSLLWLFVFCFIFDVLLCLISYRSYFRLFSILISSWFYVDYAGSFDHSSFFFSLWLSCILLCAFRVLFYFSFFFTFFFFCLRFFFSFLFFFYFFILLIFCLPLLFLCLSLCLCVQWTVFVLMPLLCCLLCVTPSFFYIITRTVVCLFCLLLYPSSNWLFLLFSWSSGSYVSSVLLVVYIWLAVNLCIVLGFNRYRCSAVPPCVLLCCVGYNSLCVWSFIFVCVFCLCSSGH